MKTNTIDINKIEEILGFSFEDKKLILTAFTHSSMLNEGAKRGNENLEFLGDSILNFVISKRLFELFEKKVDEGELTKWRARLVSSQTLIELSKKLDFSRHLAITDNGDNEHFESKKYADLFEAIVAAVYLDKGLCFVQDYLLKIYQPFFTLDKLQEGKKSDFKTRLQEFSQKHKLGEVRYIELDRSGTAHMPKFVFGVYIGDELLGMAEGKSKKVAQALSAEKALEQLEKKWGLID